MIDLYALIEKLQNAEHGSSALNCEIFRFINPEYAGPEWREAIGGLRHVNDSSDMRERPSVQYDNYTSSIDAALTLIPSKRAIVRHYLPLATYPFRFYLFADTGIPLQEYWPRALLSADVTRAGHIGALAKTEPIAICIAALTARAQHG